jgi:hypothetical protein
MVQSTMDGYAVAKYVERLTTPKDQDSNTTGRVYKVDSSQCIVTDLMLWTNDMNDCVHARFPGCQVTIRHTTSSITGFVVVIRIQSPRPARLRTAMAFVCTLMLLGAVILLIFRFSQ